MSFAEAQAEVLRVSIHAPVRGATEADEDKQAELEGFNPRPRAGGDRSTAIVVPIPEGVSIHAPVRGATITGVLAMTVEAGFNPRPRAGGDRNKEGYQDD